MADAELAPEPKCATHLETAAAGACERCGTFICAACRDPRGRCPDCARRAATVSSSRVLAGVTRGGLIAQLALKAIDLGSAALYVSGLVTPRSTAISTVSTLAASLAAVIFVITAVLFLAWWHSMVSQLEARSLHVGTSPGGAVGHWFIPFVSLERPYRVAQAAMNGLKVKAPIGTWWAFWLAYNLSALGRTKGLAPDRFSLGVAMASTGFGIVAALLCQQVIAAIQEGLDRPPEVI